MKARYAYPLLFLIPSAMVAFLVAITVVGAGAGVLWIFVYGDNPWPEAAGTILMTIASAAFALTLTMFAVMGYSFGKKREIQGGMRNSHIAIALGISIVLPILVLLHQWRIGNLGGGPVTANISSMGKPLSGAP